MFAQAIAILIVTSAELTSTLPQDGTTLPAALESSVLTTQSCVTGKHVVGICVKRERCDYGTAAIDFTLYRPRGYKLSCPSGEDVCCPLTFLVQHDDRMWVPDNGELDFDDDD